MNQLKDTGYKEEFCLIIATYVYTFRKDIKPDKIINELSNPKLKGAFMTIADRLKEEGRQEGRQEGEKKKAVETAKKLKEKGMDIELIIEVTGLSKEEIEKL